MFDKHDSIEARFARFQHDTYETRRDIRLLLLSIPIRLLFFRMLAAESLSLRIFSAVPFALVPLVVVALARTKYIQHRSYFMDFYFLTGVLQYLVISRRTRVFSNGKIPVIVSPRSDNDDGSDTHININYRTWILILIALFSVNASIGSTPLRRIIRSALLTLIVLVPYLCDPDRLPLDLLTTASLQVVFVTFILPSYVGLVQYEQSMLNIKTWMRTTNEGRRAFSDFVRHQQCLVSPFEHHDDHGQPLRTVEMDRELVSPSRAQYLSGLPSSSLRDKMRGDKVALHLSTRRSVVRHVVKVFGSQDAALHEKDLLLRLTETGEASREAVVPAVLRMDNLPPPRDGMESVRGGTQEEDGAAAPLSSAPCCRAGRRRGVEGGNEALPQDASSTRSLLPQPMPSTSWANEKNASSRVRNDSHFERIFPTPLELSMMQCQIHQTLAARGFPDMHVSLNVQRGCLLFSCSVEVEGFRMEEDLAAIQRELEAMDLSLLMPTELLTKLGKQYTVVNIPQEAIRRAGFPALVARRPVALIGEKDTWRGWGGGNGGGGGDASSVLRSVLSSLEQLAFWKSPSSSMTMRPSSSYTRVVLRIASPSSDPAYLKRHFCPVVWSSATSTYETPVAFEFHPLGEEVLTTQTGQVLTNGGGGGGARGDEHGTARWHGGDANDALIPPGPTSVLSSGASLSTSTLTSPIEPDPPASQHYFDLVVLVEPRPIGESLLVAMGKRMPSSLLSMDVDVNVNSAGTSTMRGRTSPREGSEERTAEEGSRAQGSGGVGMVSEWEVRIPVLPRRVVEELERYVALEGSRMEGERRGSGRNNMDADGLLTTLHQDEDRAKVVAQITEDIAFLMHVVNDRQTELECTGTIAQPPPRPLREDRGPSSSRPSSISAAAAAAAAAASSLDAPPRWFKASQDMALEGAFSALSLAHSVGLSATESFVRRRLLTRLSWLAPNPPPLSAVALHRALLKFSHLTPHDLEMIRFYRTLNGVSLLLWPFLTLALSHALHFARSSIFEMLGFVVMGIVLMYKRIHIPPKVYLFLNLVCYEFIQAKLQIRAYPNACRLALMSFKFMMAPLFITAMATIGETLPFRFAVLQKVIGFCILTWVLATQDECRADRSAALWLGGSTVIGWMAVLPYVYKSQRKLHDVAKKKKTE